MSLVLRTHFDLHEKVTLLQSTKFGHMLGAMNTRAARLTNFYTRETHTGYCARKTQKTKNKEPWISNTGEKYYVMTSFKVLRYDFPQRLIPSTLKSQT